MSLNVLTYPAVFFWTINQVCTAAPFKTSPRDEIQDIFGISSGGGTACKCSCWCWLCNLLNLSGGSPCVALGQLKDLQDCMVIICGYLRLMFVLGCGHIWLIPILTSRYKKHSGESNTPTFKTSHLCYFCSSNAAAKPFKCLSKLRAVSATSFRVGWDGHSSAKG